MKNSNWQKALAVTLLLGSLAFVQQADAAASQDVKVTKYTIDAGKYQIPYSGDEAEFNHEINPGYGSALVFKNYDKDGSIEFYGITDRGPNGDIPKYVEDGKTIPGKFFPTPNFTPSIGIIKVDVKNSKAEIIKSIPLKDDGRKISGKPLPQGQTGATGEIALNFQMQNLGTDASGLDTEGIALDKDGNFWISDEYGPFIAKVNKKGKILEKYAPGQGLPKILADRVPNRGSEGLTIDENGNVFAFVQSPLDVDGKTAKTAKYIRIIKFNPQTKQTAMYAYPVDTGYKNTGAAKIGDITSIGNDQFLMIEQGKQHGKMQNLIYKVDLSGATEIADNGDLEYGRLDGKITPVKKELVLDLRANGWNIEKAEGLALLPDRKTIAVVNDNDFGIAVKASDSKVPDAQVEDYTYDADAAQFTYNKDNTVHEVQMGLQKNAPEEQQSQLWLFELPEEL